MEDKISELLKPRFKLIADYPGNSQPIGNITTEISTATYFRKFPANFKELEWYEERTIDEMPEYLHYKNKILKIDKWFYMGSELRFHSEAPFITSGAYGCKPATEEEFKNNQASI